MPFFSFFQQCIIMQSLPFWHWTSVFVYLRGFGTKMNILAHQPPASWLEMGPCKWMLWETKCDKCAVNTDSVVPHHTPDHSPAEPKEISEALTDSITHHLKRMHEMLFCCNISSFCRDGWLTRFFYASNILPCTFVVSLTEHQQESFKF